MIKRNYSKTAKTSAVFPEDVWNWSNHFRPLTAAPSLAYEELEELDIQNQNGYGRHHIDMNVPPTTSTPIASLTPTTVSSRLLSYRTRPFEIKKVLAFEHPEQREALEEVIRYMPEHVPVDNPVSQLMGEEGETIAANHFQNLETLTNDEAEKFLLSQSLNHRSSHKSKNSRQVPSFFTPRPSRTVPTTPQTVSTAPDSKTKLRSLLYELVHQMGNVVSSSSSDDQFDMDVNINIRKRHKRTKRIVNNRESDDSAPQNTDDYSMQPKISLNLQINL